VPSAAAPAAATKPVLVDSVQPHQLHIRAEFGTQVSPQRAAANFGSPGPVDQIGAAFAHFLRERAVVTGGGIRTLWPAHDP
jgi:hypothetical protein